MLSSTPIDAVVKMPLGQLLQAAEELTLAGHGNVISYSRKVFIPLTQLCRDVCHYCTFARIPSRLQAPYLTIDQCLEIARAGAKSGCKEALFTLGDQPELRYATARAALEKMGFATTLDYLHAAAQAVFKETGLLPHLNAGLMSAAAMSKLRAVSVSMGLMLESASTRLCERGGPHFGSPDKLPERRLEMLGTAGKLQVPFTTGLLIGIGETRTERIDALLAIRNLHEAHGHIQEIIIQNFRAKPGTAMATAAEPALEEHLWTIAVARLIFGPQMTIQAPPNLRLRALNSLIHAGINDWGGVSPVTVDHVNPERPWPELSRLNAETSRAGRHLVERLAIAPSYALQPSRWADVSMRQAIYRSIDATGHARTDGWFAGTGQDAPERNVDRPRVTTPGGAARISTPIAKALRRAMTGDALDEPDIVSLFHARNEDLDAVILAADTLRRSIVGDTVTYVINRNINYTNICLYRCGFCAFSKGRGRRDLRGPAYRLDTAEIARRTVEAHTAGATEVCLQGGIHPDYTGETYLQIVRAVKDAVPQMHVHAFSPLEITHGARTLNLPLEAYLRRLQDAGLSTLPGTAAEILDDEVRAVICPDKLNTNEWFDVMRAAHNLGLRTTATIMFGHVDRPVHWARHLLRIRALQAVTGGFTEFVPLPYVHMESPLSRQGVSRSGPTFREALLMHAVARLALHPHFHNIQTSWVKMGPQGAVRCLQAGANDLGGTLMNESITRAAGGKNGQALDAARMQELIAGIGRRSAQRTTAYDNVKPQYDSTTPQYRAGIDDESSLAKDPSGSSNPSDTICTSF